MLPKEFLNFNKYVKNDISFKHNLKGIYNRIRDKYCNRMNEIIFKWNYLEIRAFYSILTICIAHKLRGFIGKSIPKLIKDSAVNKRKKM